MLKYDIHCDIKITICTLHLWYSNICYYLFVLNPLFLTNKYEVPIIYFNSLLLIILLPRGHQGPFPKPQSQLCPVLSSMSLRGFYSVHVIKKILHTGDTLSLQEILLTNGDRSTELNTYLFLFLLRFCKRCLYSGTFTNNKIFFSNVLWLPYLWFSTFRSASWA